MNTLSDTPKETPTDLNSKVTRAALVTLSVFLALYSPAILLSCITPFLPTVHVLHTPMIMDVFLALFFVNNIVNPFIYFFILKDFKEGYKVLLTCGKYNKQESVEVCVIESHFRQPS